MLITYLGAAVWLFLIMMICHGALFDRIEKRKKWFWISLGALLCGLLTTYIGTEFNIYQIDTVVNRYVLFFVGTVFFSWLGERYGNKTKNVGIDVPVWR